MPATAVRVHLGLLAAIAREAGVADDLAGEVR
jgi:hypothetical protein